MEMSPNYPFEVTTGHYDVTTTEIHCSPGGSDECTEDVFTETTECVPSA